MSFYDFKMNNMNLSLFLAFFNKKNIYKVQCLGATFKKWHI